MSSQPQNFRKAVLKRLIDRDLTIKDLADLIGKRRNTVSLAVHHERMFEPTKELIRKELGL